MKFNSLNLAEYIDSCLADKNISYSPKDSSILFFNFYSQLGYSDKSVKAIRLYVSRTHELYPSLAWLNKQISAQGIIATGKTITPGSAHGTSCLHFLLIAGLISISFYDYFCVNPRAIGKLDRWMDQSKGRLGIDDFVEALVEVSKDAENRKVNLARMWRKASRVGIYLVLRYRLDSLRDITVEQWRSFVLECRDHSRTTAAGYANNVAPVRLMHDALFNMGVLEEPYNRKFGGVRSIEKKRNCLDVPGFGEYAVTFLERMKPQVESKTYQHYCTTLELFCEFLQDRQNGNVNIGTLVRADIVAYVSFLFKKQKVHKNSFSWLEARSYNVKTFLTFIAEHPTEFGKRGMGVFKKKIFVDQDFQVPHVNSLPRSIEKDIRMAFAKVFQNCHSYRYVLTFRLMLHAGLALADALCLKDDCITYDELTGKHKISIWRAKTRKQRVVKPMAETVEVVRKLKEMNTQKVPTVHPDGSRVIFLLNDAGVPCGPAWFGYHFDRHKELAAQACPELASGIAMVTPHQLRHTFATLLREGGADIMLIKELMLHENIKTTSKYTKESDKLKVELIQRLENGEYVCNEYPELNQSYLNSEQGKDFVENLVKHENKFSYGRCTVDGFNNCKKAYRCLSCGYLCSTEDDLPELISALTIQRTRIEKLDSDIALENDIDRLNAQGLEREKSMKRLVAIMQKIRKVQAVQPEMPDSIDAFEAESGSPDDDSIIQFL